MNRNTLGTMCGILIAAFFGSGIFFDPEEPLKMQVYVATIISGALIGLMVGAVFNKSTSWLKTLIGSALLAGLMGASISIAKGFEDAPFAIPFNAVEGLIIASILKRWAE